MKITVTPHEDDSTNHCAADPIAQALREAVGLERCTAASASRFAAMAQPSRLFARGPKGQIMCETPRLVRDWIVDWDNGAGGEPITFDVEITPRTEVSSEYYIPGSGIFGRG
jgi:hypothetical protein